MNHHHKYIVKLWETQYSSETHTYLQHREVKWRVINDLMYKARSPQIHMRPILLRTIRSISKPCQLSNTSVHLAVYLLDYFMDNHDLKFDTMLLVTFACLTLAAKIEEHCLNIPKLNNMCRFMSKNVTNSHFRKVEMKILMFFNCSIAVPTVAHFIEFYRDYFYCNTHSNHKVSSVLKNKFDRMILIYQDISLENTKLISYNPSTIAASIILATRHELGLTPCWTAQLRKVTGYLKKDLVKCCSLLGRNVMQHRKCEPIDEGYLSSSPDFQLPIIMATKKKRTLIDMPNIISAKRIAFQKSVQL